MTYLRVFLVMPFFVYACSQGNFQRDGGTLYADSITDAENNVDRGCAYYYFLLAKSAEVAGREHYNEALESYEKALSCDKNSGFIRRDLAMLLSKMGKLQQGIDRLRQAIVLNPKDIQSRIMLANFHTSSNEYDTAVEIYREVLKIDPNNSEVRLILGSLYARQKRYEEAQHILEELISMDKTAFLGYRYLAGLYRELRLQNRARETYSKALELQWSNILAFELAELHESMEQYDDAIKLYRRILVEDEASERARLGMVRDYLYLGNNELALEELRALRMYSTDSKQVNLSIGQLLLSMRKYDEAIAQLNELLEDEPGSSMLIFLLALAHHEKGDDEAAKKLLLSLDPETDVYEEGVLLLVNIYKNHEEMAAAEELLLSLLKEEGNGKLPFYLALASLYREQKKNEAAQSLFNEILENYPDNPRVLFDYGMYLDQTGDTAGAIEKMKRILELEPDNPFALNYIGYSWADKEVNLEQAEAYLLKAVSLRPDDGFIRDSLGWAYFKLNKLELASEELEKAIELEPNDPTIREHLGDAYAKLGKFQEAVRMYEKALALYAEEEKKIEVRRKLESLHP